MSVQDIVKYVRQTPGNTNPSVIASMVNAEMNSTLKAANEYTDSQRLAYEEIEQVTLFPKKEITLESNDEFGGLLVWQSETIEIPQLKIFEFLAQHKNAIFVVNVNGQVYEYVWTDNMIGAGGIITIGNQAIMGAGDDTGDPFLFVISPEGTGLVYENPNSLANMSITASLTLKAETIHQIDPKFIPDVVIDLNDFQYAVEGGAATFNDEITLLFMNNLSKGGGTSVDAVRDVDSSLKKACTAKHNFKVRLNLDDKGIVDFPVAYAFDPSFGALQLSGSFVMTLDGYTYFETIVNMQFVYNSETVNIFNSVTIINAG